MAEIEFKSDSNIFCHHCLSNIDRQNSNWRIAVYQWGDQRIPDLSQCKKEHQTFQAFDTTELCNQVAFVPVHIECAENIREEQQRKAFDSCGPKEERIAVKDTLARRKQLADILWFYNDKLASATCYRTAAKPTSPVDSFSYVLEAHTWKEINNAPVIQYVEKNAQMRSLVMGVLTFEIKWLQSFLHTMKTTPHRPGFSWWVMSEHTNEMSSEAIPGKFFYLVILYLDETPVEVAYQKNVEGLLARVHEEHTEQKVSEYLDIFLPVNAIYQANMGADGAVFNAKRSKPGYFSAVITVNSNSLGLVFSMSKGRIVQPSMFHTNGIVPTFFDIGETSGQMIKQSLGVEKDQFDKVIESYVIYKE